MKRIIRTAIVIATAFGLAACGGDDGSAETVAAETATASATGESATSTEETTAPTAADSASDTATDATPADEVAAFPVTIEHKYGETTIDAEPQKIVSIGFGEHDGLLSLGVTPIAVRDWYGEQPYATWPWAQDELGEATPEVLPSTELNFEQIAALQPDLIMGIASGMTDADYAKLSAIAPTVAQPGDFIDYGTPWDVSIEMAGRAVGKPDVAAQVIADTKQLFTDARAAHPEFEGATAAVTFYFEEAPGAYGSQDIRSRALTDLGFVIPTAIDEAAGDAFFVSISAEDLSLIDTDVVVWIGAGADAFESIRTLPTRASTRAFQEGREIVADDLLSGAFSHANPLSFEYVIEQLVPELALAVDGDPATVVPSAAVIADETADAAATGDDQTAAAADAWTLVFDSTVTYDEKAAHLADAEALQAIVESYTSAGEAMGGISLVPTDVVVSGESATVTYDVMFGDSAAYEDLTGVISLVDGTWVVSREEFCSFMASARNSCPAG